VTQIMVRIMALAAAALLLPGLTACGFQLRGANTLPFDSIYIGIPDDTQFGAEIRRAIRAVSPDTVQVDRPEDAQVRLQNLALTRERREVSLSPQGRVEEYELSLTFRYRLIDGDGRILIPDTTLTASHDLPYDAQVVQAKQGEMEMLYQNMQRNLVDRILHRLTAPDIRQAALRADAARRGQQADDLPLVAPEAAPNADAQPPKWQTTPSDFEAPGRHEF